MGTIRTGGYVNLAELIAATRGDRIQEQLAEDAGMSVQSMRQYMAGAYPKKNLPDSATLRGLATALHIDVDTVIDAAKETLSGPLGRRTRNSSGPTLAALLPPEAAYLPPEAVAALRILIITSGRAAMEQAERPQTPAPRQGS
jgi:transcriptional regulator with XRE-family HTH domain